MTNSLLMEELDAFTYRELISNGEKIIVVPVGAIEQHGPHMPVSVDAILSKELSKALAEKVDGLVAPGIVFGYKSQQRSGGGYHLSGGLFMSGITLINQVKELVLEIVSHGNRKIVFCNGHYENYQFMFEGIDLALRELKLQGIDDVKVLLLSYWDFVDDETIEKLYPEGFTGWDLEHGGVLETSLMLLLHPDKVDMNKVEVADPAVMPNYDILPIQPELTPDSGCLSCAKNATVQKGEILLTVASEGMAKAVNKEFS
ncbi:creatininase [Actinomyces sp. zg-332]|uniref:creatininase n=1 Tax=Actinomyces sp. zg-332 TaxID=2708340 RepID=UPI00141E666E|nr:creatininase [Actinomyces sp. zg-332]QPK94029.1 creatininase [Actinomyces sp. zg-332]